MALDFTVRDVIHHITAKFTQVSFTGAERVVQVADADYIFTLFDVCANTTLILDNGLVRQPGWLPNKSRKTLRVLPSSAEVVRKLKFPNNSSVKIVTGVVQVVSAFYGNPAGLRGAVEMVFGTLNLIEDIQNKKDCGWYPDAFPEGSEGVCGSGLKRACLPDDARFDGSKVQNIPWYIERLIDVAIPGLGWLIEAYDQPVYWWEVIGTSNAGICTRSDNGSDWHKESVAETAIEW